MFLYTLGVANRFVMANGEGRHGQRSGSNEQQPNLQRAQEGKHRSRELALSSCVQVIEPSMAARAGRSRLLRLLLGDSPRVCRCVALQQGGEQWCWELTELEAGRSNATGVREGRGMHNRRHECSIRSLWRLDDASKGDEADRFTPSHQDHIVRRVRNNRGQLSHNQMYRTPLTKTAVDQRRSKKSPTFRCAAVAPRSPSKPQAHQCCIVLRLNYQVCCWQSETSMREASN